MAKQLLALGDAEVPRERRGIGWGTANGQRREHDCEERSDYEGSTGTLQVHIHTAMQRWPRAHSQQSVTPRGGWWLKENLAFVALI